MELLREHDSGTITPELATWAFLSRAVVQTEWTDGIAFAALWLLWKIGRFWDHYVYSKSGLITYPHCPLRSYRNLSGRGELRKANLLTSNQKRHALLLLSVGHSTVCYSNCCFIRLLAALKTVYVEYRLHTKIVDMEYSFLLSKWQSPSLGMTMPASLLSIPKWESASLTKTRRWRESFRQPIFPTMIKSIWLVWKRTGIYWEWITYAWTHSDYQKIYC